MPSWKGPCHAEKGARHQSRATMRAELGLTACWTHPTSLSPVRCWQGRPPGDIMSAQARALPAGLSTHSSAPWALMSRRRAIGDLGRTQEVCPQVHPQHHPGSVSEQVSAERSLSPTSEPTRATSWPLGGPCPMGLSYTRSPALSTDLQGTREP